MLLDLVVQARDAFGVEVELLDVGGGFGVTYKDEAAPEIEAAGAAIRERLRRSSEERRVPVPELIVEPGRAVVANAVLTVYRVGSVKRVPDARTFVAVDGGMSDNIRPMLYGARYTVAPAGRPREGAHEIVTVVGKHCESGDVVASDVKLLGGACAGDLLAVAATGAYCYPMASNYNRLGRPAVVAVRDGAVRSWLRETDEDLDRLEAEL